MAYDTDLKQKLLKIVNEKSIIRGPITLASGKKSSYYIDAKRTTLDRDGIVLAAKLFTQQLQDIDSIGGPTMGADPFLGAVLYECWQQKIPLNAFIVRKQPKKHGTQQMIEGPLVPGAKVAIIEDVITTGNSIYKAIEHVEKFGAKITKVLILVDREEGGVKFLEDKGYPVFPILKTSELSV